MSDTRSPLQGIVVSVAVQPGDRVAVGSSLVVIESMKMQHPLRAEAAGVVLDVLVRPGDHVSPGDVLLTLNADDRIGADDGGAAFIGEPHAEAGAASAPVGREATTDHLRPELAELRERRALLEDASRPEAVERRRATGQRTVRENVVDLVDPGSFEEYGGFVIAAQRRRRDLDELVRRTPADGLVAGIGRVNGDHFGERAACAVLAYDYTVLAGTQGQMNHRKKDRLFELIERLRLPTVLFAEGGGGRPGDTDTAGVTGLDVMAFALFGRLSGLVPTVGIASGWCFAGNAALLGCCDVIIATEGTSIGMGGPAMIEGGGLGVVRPEEVGPLDVQTRNGVVDIPVADEAEAVATAKRYLAYFQGDLDSYEVPDQDLLRSVVPENRLEVYDTRAAVHLLADVGSVLELRADFGLGMVTALARIEGRPLGIVANNPTHLSGAIDADGADKAARFLQLCEAHGLPVLFLCDTPGFMVGPEAERTALVRHVSRLFVVGASLTVPFATVVLRKGYGLGAQSMAGGSFRAPLFTVAWPTGELGGMGLEGAVRLGYRREIEAAPAEEREALYERLVRQSYEHGKALNVATYFEIDDVIDPAHTRTRVAHAFAAAGWGRRGRARRGRRPFVDTW